MKGVVRGCGDFEPDQSQSQSPQRLNVFASLTKQRSLKHEISIKQTYSNETGTNLCLLRPQQRTDRIRTTRNQSALSGVLDQASIPVSQPPILSSSRPLILPFSHPHNLRASQPPNQAWDVMFVMTAQHAN